MLKYKEYFNDLLKINKQLNFIIGNKTKESISQYTDILSDDYINKLKKIINKYLKTEDYELKLEIIYIKKYIKLQIFLYFILSSYENEILKFEYDNEHLYPIEYKYDREKYFHEHIKSIIKNLEKGVKLNITIPYVICNIFLKQIKNIKKYNYLYKYIKTKYLKKCRKSIGIYDTPNGNEIYKLLILYNIGLNKSPEDIHNIGLSLLPTKIKKIKINIYDSRSELLKDSIKYAKYIYDNIIDKYFNYKPSKEFKIKEVPIKLEKSSPLAYYNTEYDTVFINLIYYKECDKNTLYSLLMHECFHQYHFRFMKHNKLDNYKIFGYNNLGLIEGFAHYMEIYCENYDDNNEYSLLRKIRLVADTGINYKQWSYKKTYKFMLKYMPNKHKDIKNEIERYICIPGQSLSYTLGKLEIIKLRDRYLANNKGTIKDFHHNLLINGNISFISLSKILK